MYVCMYIRNTLTHRDTESELGIDSESKMQQQQQQRFLNLLPMYRLCMYPVC